MTAPRRKARGLSLLGVASLGAATLTAAGPGVAGASPSAQHGQGGRHGRGLGNWANTTTPIQHLVVIYGENISFDHYFATYPQALNPPGEPAFHAASGTPAVNGLNGALLSHNPNLSNPQRLGPTQALTCDQDHGYTAEQKAFDQGLMDQFVQNTGRGLTLQQCLTKVGNAAPATGTSPNYAVMDYFDGNTVTGLWNYAQHFAMSDNAYNTGFGPSTPGALEVAAGTTYGATCGDPADTYGPVPECAATTAAATPGVIHPAGPGTVYSDDDPTYDACSSTKDPRIGMAGRNIGDLLNATGTTWGWFQGGFRPSTRNSTVDPVCASAHDNIGGKSVRDYVPHREPFQYYPQTANPRHLQPTSAAAVGLTDQANHQYDLSDFWAAAQTGHMPAVSYLKAGDYQSGHAGSSDPLDEQHFLVNTINQLQRMPTWSSTAVVITYDDSDGWYDHQLGPILNQSQTPLDALSGPGQCGTNPAKVPSTDSGAPEQARCGFGPRVPFLVISPYARANFVSSHLIDQSSVVRFIEDNWSLGRLGNGSADALAGSITSMFDFTRCQGPAVCPRRRTGNLPTGGHEFSPVAASRSPGGDSGEGLHPLAGGGLSKTHAVALGDHRGNAKLVFSASLRLNATGAGIYSRPEQRLRGLRRSPVKGRDV